MPINLHREPATLIPNRWMYIFFVSGVVFSFSAAPAVAQSLWQNRTAAWSNPIGDLRAHLPGDILVVTIDQSTDVQNKDQRLLNKQGSSDSSTNGSFGLSGLIGTAVGGAESEHATNANRSFNGDTQFKSERDFIDRFSVTVVDVLPNGNLLIAGNRHVTLDGDKRTLTLTGVVRSVDINPANSVSSRLVSQLEILYDSDGAESKFLNQGWLGKRLNRKWPF